MGFYDRFELLELLRDDGVKSFRALEIATRRPVEAHLFVNPHAPLSVALLQRVGQLPESERVRILDRGTHEGTPYLVTVPLAGYPGFREWVTAKNRPPAEPSLPPAGSTRVEPLNKAGAWTIDPPASHSPLAPRPPLAPAPAPPALPPNALDGQFNSLFPSGEMLLPSPLTAPRQRPIPQQPVVSADPASGSESRTLTLPAAQIPVPAAPPPVPPERTGLLPGGVSRTRTLQIPAVLQTSAPPASPSSANASVEILEAQTWNPGPPASAPAGSPPSWPPAAPPSHGPGEFTQLFAAERSDQGPAPQAPPVPPGGPGEFTQLFAARTAPPQAPPPVLLPAATQQPGAFTQLFQAQNTQAHTLQAQTVPAQTTLQVPVYSSAPPPPSSPESPGEFTRMLDAQSALQTPVSAGQFARTQSVTTPPPGEFTRMLQAHPAQTAPPQAPGWTNPATPLPSTRFPSGPHQAAQAGPHTSHRPAGQFSEQPTGQFTGQPAGQQGEFTRFFEAPIGPMPQSPLLQQPLQPVTPSGTNKVGEFTQVFGPRAGGFQAGGLPASAASSGPPLVSGGSGASSSGATQGFSLPMGGYGYPPGTFPPAAPAAPAQPNYYDLYNVYTTPTAGPTAGPTPGDFTQKFAAPAQLTLGQNPGAQAPDPPSRMARLRPHLPLILGIAALILVSALVIVLFTHHK